MRHRRAMGWQHPYHRKKSAPKRFAAPWTVALPLAAFTAVFVWDGPDPGFTRILGGSEHAVGAGANGNISATFSRCSGAVRYTCVVDGDTIWLAGEKIRLSDIDTPEISKPRCAREAKLGERATVRLTAMLNEGAFALVRDPFGADEDRYGRKLRMAQRKGDSLGERLVSEGLAVRWGNGRPDWC